MNMGLIKQRDFFLLILGKLVSLLGCNMQLFALSLYALSLTGSATIFATGYIKKIKVGRLCYMSFILIAISILVMALIPSKAMIRTFNGYLIPYIVLSIISFMTGVLATIANIAMGTIFNQVTPIELMGRTSTVFNLAVTIFIPIGQMLFGYLYDIISASYVILVSGAILIFTIKRYKALLTELDEPEDGMEGDVLGEI